jgi:CHASE3 domain sensor protein
MCQETRVTDGLTTNDSVMTSVSGNIKQSPFAPALPLRSHGVRLLVIGCVVLSSVAIAAGSASMLAGLIPEKQPSAAIAGIHEVMAGVGSLMANLQAIESSQHLLLLTEDPADRLTYAQGLTSIARNLMDLHRLTADVPAQRDLVETLGGLIRARLALLGQSIDLARAGDMRGGIDLLRDGEGRRLNHAMRDTITAIVGAD